MNEEKIAEIINSVGPTITDKWGGATGWSYNAVKKAADEIVKYMQAEIDAGAVERAQLEAKVFAYEAILSNSNFKMAVIKKEQV